MKCPKCGRKVMMVSNNEGKKVAVCTVCDLKYNNKKYNSDSDSIEKYLDSVNDSKNVKPIDLSKKIIKRGWD